jgi:hypothetical protein
MKANPSNQPTNHTQPPNKRSDRDTRDRLLEQVAEKLTTLAHQRLPDRVLKGILTGHEADIRQSAILLALAWYLHGSDPGTRKNTRPWHPVKAIAGALRIIKRDTIKALLNEAENQHRIPPSPSKTCHPAMVRFCDWPTDLKQNLCARAIRIALREGSISPCNAVVAEAVYVRGIEVSDLAKLRGVHRSSIYQHLTKTRTFIQEIIQSLDVPLEQIS